MHYKSEAFRHGILDKANHALEGGVRMSHGTPDSKIAREAETATEPVSGSGRPAGELPAAGGLGRVNSERSSTHHEHSHEQHPEPEMVRGVLKANGLRYSRPREVILGFLLEEDRHVSAEGLYLNLKQRGEDLSLSTVYLNLSALAEAGLVCEFRGASGESLYDSNVSPHYHVVCKETGAILDVAAPVIDGKPLGRYLKDAIEAATGWRVDEPHLSLSGISPDAGTNVTSPTKSD